MVVEKEGIDSFIGEPMKPDELKALRTAVPKRHGFLMKSTKDKKEVFSKFEKKVAISILTGMSVSKCSKLFEINGIMSQTILNTFCMKSNRFLYDKLQGRSYPWPAIGRLREHAEVFINDCKKLENVTIDSSIWALPDVPTMTLNSIWNRKIYTIRNLLKNSQRDLLQFKYLGKTGLKKLILSLSQYGFSIKEKEITQIF
jgi:hypothetical protein